MTSSADGCIASQLTCPAFLLNGLSLLDYSTHWGDYPTYFADIAAVKGNDEAACDERLKRVVKWFMSTLYGSYHARCKNGQEKKPFNPILGEQLFTSWPNGNRMVIEQGTFALSLMLCSTSHACEKCAIIHLLLPFTWKTSRQTFA